MITNMNLDKIFLTDHTKKQIVDLVYTFVNPLDETWRNKYYTYNKTIDNARFDFSEEQITFSINTVKKYMHWINKIYIVSDDQRVSITDPYLSQKIIWVDHKDIIPKEYLPTFNSMTIEAHLGNIAGLNEHFLYMNDDMFLGNLVHYDDFFDKDETPIQFYGRCRYYNHSWIKNVKSTNELFDQYYKKDYHICPQHAPYFIQKSVFLKVKSIFDKFLNHSFKNHKIRSYKNSHNLIFLYAMYSFYKKLSINKKASFSPITSLTPDKVEKLKRNRKQFYCFYSRFHTEEQQRLYKELQNVILT
jgi:hypothetical protein